jgi:hypothetical protein
VLRRHPRAADSDLIEEPEQREPSRQPQQRVAVRPKISVHCVHRRMSRGSVPSPSYLSERRLQTLFGIDRVVRQASSHWNDAKPRTSVVLESGRGGTIETTNRGHYRPKDANRRYSVGASGSKILRFEWMSSKCSNPEISVTEAEFVQRRSGSIENCSLGLSKVSFPRVDSLMRRIHSKYCRSSI